MPIQNYSVLAGDPVAGKVVTGSGTHYQITMNTPAGPYTVAVNILSDDSSQVLYSIEENFTPPALAALTALPMGLTPLPTQPNQPNPLALDFVRSTINGAPMITKAQMALLPPPAKNTKGSVEEQAIRRAKSLALQNAVITLLNMTIADKDGVIYAFGSSYADPGQQPGIHDIHMNQGNPKNDHGGDNGIWQDGALFIHLPTTNTWTAVFIAFQEQIWTTDNSGNPT